MQPNSRTIARYLSGECTPREQRSIEAWLDASPENRRVLDQHATIWKVAGNGSITPQFADHEMQEDLEGLRAAMRDLQRRNVSPDRAPVARRKAVRRERTFSRSAIAAAAVVVFLAGSWLAGRLFTEEDSPSAVREVATLSGQRARVPLGDGTFVRLNVASKIRFPESFTNGKREVYLEGEAFFEVNEDPSRPFLVHASNAVVQVLGTSFNVRAYEGDQKVDVLVSRGTVALQRAETPDGEDVILTSEQLGRLTGSSLERLTGRADVHRHLAWMENRLVFEDTRLSEVATELERWYSLDVRLANPEISEWRLTASFKNESIDEILSVIAASVGVRHSRKRETVTFFL